ncbi:MAG: beta-galactosidase, partial [Anaerolineales bacterium]|nr:beta-galactosidase [Anaerolineales bacterium]
MYEKNHRPLASLADSHYNSGNSINWRGAILLTNIPAQITPTATSTIISTFEVDEEVVINPVPVSDYLSNPGMGWQNDSSEGASSGYFPETVIYSSREKIAWNSLNPQEGVYDWSAIDEQLEYAIARGKQFSFRVYTVRGESFGGNQIPDWVLNKGACISVRANRIISNCVYQQEWGRFVSALIAKYDGNPQSPLWIFRD